MEDHLPEALHIEPGHLLFLHLLTYQLRVGLCQVVLLGSCVLLQILDIVRGLCPME